MSMNISAQTRTEVKRNWGLAYFRQLPRASLHRSTEAVLRELAFATWSDGADAGYSMRGTIRLCGKLKMSFATLNRHLAKLEVAGLIRRVRRGRRRRGAWGGRLVDRIELVGFVAWLRRNRPQSSRVYRYFNGVLNKVQAAKSKGGVSPQNDGWKEKILSLTQRTAAAASSVLACRGWNEPDEGDWASLAECRDRVEVLA